LVVLLQWEKTLFTSYKRYGFTVYTISSRTDIKAEFNGFAQIVLRKFPVKKLNFLYYYVASALHAVIKGRYDLVHIHHIDGAFILFYCG